MTLKDKYALVGIGYTEQGKVPGRTAHSLCMEAALNAIDDAGLLPTDIGGIFIQPSPSDPLSGSYPLANRLG